MTRLPRFFAGRRRISFGTQMTLRSYTSLSDLTPARWYLSIHGAKDQERIHQFRNADFGLLTTEEVARFHEEWVNNEEVSVTMKRENLECSVRPLWVSFHTHPNETSDLYISILPVDPTYEKLFLERSEPQARFNSKWTFENCDWSEGDWKCYFVGLNGCLGASKVDTLWPTTIFHEGRTLPNPKSFYDLGEFLADATKERIQKHRTHIYGLESKNGFPVSKNFTFRLLNNRWGIDALIQNKIEL